VCVFLCVFVCVVFFLVSFGLLLLYGLITAPCRQRKNNTDALSPIPLMLDSIVPVPISLTSIHMQIEMSLIRLALI
jgi:hypothetical protein